MKLPAARDIEELIVELPRDERIVLERLRALIFQAEPRIVEKLSYGVPYYFRNRRLFFLWPASLEPFGPKTTSRQPVKVTLGFCYGNLLSNSQGILERNDRKQVFTVPFTRLDDIDERVISEVMNEAVIVDQQFFGRNNK